MSITPEKYSMVKRAIEREFGSSVVLGIRKFENGFVNLNYEVELSNPRQVVVLRIYSRRTWRDRLSLERQIIDMLATRTNVPVPAILAYSADNPDVGKPYMILTRVPGVTLSDALPTLTDDEQRQVGSQIGSYLAEIHSITFTSFGEIASHSLLTTRSEKSYNLSRVQQLLEQCEAHDLLSLKEIHRVAKKFMDNADCFDRSHSVLIHGDVNAQNIIVDSRPSGTVVTGFVDFERSAAWSPEIDFAKILDFTCTRYSALGEGIIRGYSEYTNAGIMSLIFDRRLGLFEILLDFQVLVDMAHSYVGAVARNMIRDRHLPLLHFQRLYALLDKARLDDERRTDDECSTDAEFLQQAYQLASLSTCRIRQVGAVIVRNGRVIATGYNALSSVEGPCWCNHSEPNEDPDRPPCPAVHAEQNALLDALNKERQVRGATLYCTTCPCILCARLLIGAGIERVVYCEEYINNDGFHLLRRSGVHLEKILDPRGNLDG